MWTEFKAKDVACWQGTWPKQSPYSEVLKTEVYPAGNEVNNGSFMRKNDMNSNTVKRKLD